MIENLFFLFLILEISDYQFYDIHMILFLFFYCHLLKKEKLFLKMMLHYYFLMLHFVFCFHHQLAMLRFVFCFHNQFLLLHFVYYLRQCVYINFRMVRNQCKSKKNYRIHISNLFYCFIYSSACNCFRCSKTNRHIKMDTFVFN